jgi:WD40 repeat protein
MRSLANKCHLAIALSLVLISSFAFSLQEPDSPALVMQTGHAGYIRAIDISQNSEIAVTGADDSSIRVWQLPSGIELRRIFTGTAVRAVAISPDGRTVAAASFQSLSIWTIESGIREHSWSYFDSNAYVLPGVAFSRDGHTVVVADNGHVFAWDASSGKLLRAESFRNAIQCFATLQGTDNIALCQNESVTIWNLQTFKSVLTLQPSRTTFPFSPDFLAAYRQGIKLTNGRLGDGVKLPEEPDPAMVVNVGFSKDFQFIVTNNADGSVHIWDAATGLESHVIKAEAYENIAVNPTGRTFAGGEAEKVVIRNLATGDAEEELVPPKTNQSGIVMALFSRSPGKICPLRYSPDGLQLVEALVLENRLVVWNLRTRRSISTTHASISVPYAFVSSDHQHLYSVTGDVVKSWNLGLLPIPNVTPANTVFGVAVSKDGEWIGWDTSARFEIVNVADPQRTRYSLFKCPQDGRLVQCGQGVEVGLDEIIGFSQDDQSVIVHQTSEFDPATLFDKGITNSFYAVHPREGSIDTLFTLPPSAPTTAAFTPERNLIAWAEKGLLPFQPNAGASFHGNIHIFDIDTRTESKSLAFATMSNEQIAEMVKQTITDNPEGYKDLLLGRIGWQQGRRDASRVVALAFSSDGKMMAAAHQFYGLGLWQLDDQRLIFQTGAHLQTDGKPEAQPTALCFSPDGRWLIAGWNDGSISKFDTSSGTRVARWTGHENTVNSISYAPNSKLLFTTSEDGTIKFWNPETNEQELAISPGLDSNDWAVIAPNGLFDGGADGWVRFLWRFQSSIFSTYPVDIYFREYFHPGLLREFFACQYGDPSACDRIGTTQPFSRKSRTQPVVNSISVVKLDSKNSVSVVVDVGYPHPKFGSPSWPRSVYDIRLLRDGQLEAIS